MTVVWLIGMGIGALVSAFTFFGSGPESAPQQAVVGIWSLYYLVLPYTCCRAIEAIVNAQQRTPADKKDSPKRTPADKHEDLASAYMP